MYSEANFSLQELMQDDDPEGLVESGHKATIIFES